MMSSPSLHGCDFLDKYAAISKNTLSQGAHSPSDDESAQLPENGMMKKKS